MKFKKVKKWVAGMMLGIVGLGSFGSAIVCNSAQVSAMSTSSGTVVAQGWNYPIELYNYGEDDWGFASSIKLYYNDDKTTDAGNYLIRFKPSQTLVNSSVKIKIEYFKANISGQHEVLYNSTFTSTDIISLSFSVTEKSANGYIQVSMDNTEGSYPGENIDCFYLEEFLWTYSDTHAPVFNGEAIHYTNVDKPRDLATILTGITAVDETNGEVPIVIEEDNFTANRYKMGNYTVLLSATDGAGNKATMTLTIYVIDVTAPVISGPTALTSNMSSPLTEAAIRSKLSVSDNCDTNITIDLVEDKFTGHSQESGSFTVTYKAVDDSGNVSGIHTVTVTTKDDIAPTITGTSHYNVSSIGAITLDYMKSQLTITDNIDSADKITFVVMENNYIDNSTFVGDHTVIVYALDSLGNKSENFVITVTVYDNIAPVFWTNEDFFSVDDSLKLTHDDIVAILIAQSKTIESTNVAAYSVIKDEYSSNANAAGNYGVAYQLKMVDGSVVQLASNIKVIGEEDNVIDQVENTEKIEQRATNIWKNIGNVIKNFGEFFNKLLKSLVRYILQGWLWCPEWSKPSWNNWY